VATVSHDLRAPLNSIIGFASAVGQIGPLSEQQTEFVGRITDSAQRMSSLVAALLDLARVDSRLELVREPCDVMAIARTVLTDLQGQAMARDVDLRLEVRQMPAPIFGDPTQIHQAISNLVDNAIKYSPAGEQVQLILDMRDGSVMIKVQDHGEGIPAKDIPHIFDKFYRVRGRETKGGAGLGLTLVRSIAEAHSGWVWVESEQQMGSTFTMQLPVGNGTSPGEEE
jgi:signal transduction histidine kinase